MNRSLIVAAKARDEETINRLLKEGADPNTHDNLSLHLPIWKKVFQEFLHKQLDANADGATALELVFSEDQATSKQAIIQNVEPVGIVRTLLAHGAHADINDAAGEPLIIQPISLGYSRCVDLMLANGSNANARIHGVVPVLVIAVGNKDAEMVKILLEKGADPNVSFGDGYPVDAYAEMNELHEIASLLKGAKKYSTNRGIR